MKKNDTEGNMRMSDMAVGIRELAARDAAPNSWKGICQGKAKCWFELDVGNRTGLGHKDPGTWI